MPPDNVSKQLPYGYKPLIYTVCPSLLKSVRKFIDDIPWTKLHKKAENATKASSQDQHEIILQANKDADDSEVKKAAQKDSHRILAKCVIDPNQVDGEKAKSALEESFKANN
ncbi:hypothetical protein BO71DRAFT_434119 [Aspergillus ellipticus CBS 707.79]|uniref:Uncharacterized protein n=1 Tax=Aspergillus ellipticus CBS 707.79 TaxID=1448320 RepID=A0A319DGH0_9EURO|nr:hypothetical protein BO71DRAFT_434119 [Aspergillus ellipticus CBS 707.79]